MGWFDEQIRQRKQNDQEVFEDSIFHMASAILGQHGAERISDIRFVTKAAIDDVLKYYRFKAMDYDIETEDPEEALELSLRPYGIMHRRVKLSKDWYKDAFGPMIGYMGEAPVALIPRKFGGYQYTDSSTGEVVNIGEKNAEQFADDAICFYKPLPLRSLSIRDLLVFMKDCINGTDAVLFIILSFLIVAVGMTLPQITEFTTGFILNTGKLPLLWGTMILLVCAMITSRVIDISNSFMKTRIQSKASLSVEAAVMMRLMSLPAPFFKKYSAGELSKRSSSVNMLCELLIGEVFSISVTSVISLLYVTQIYTFAPCLVIPSLFVIIGTVLLSAILAVVQMRIMKKIMEFEAKETGISFSLLSGIQKIKLAGAEKRAFAKWAESYTKGANLKYNPPVFIKMNETLTLAITLIGSIVIYYLATVNGIKPSQYIAFQTAYGMTMGAFTSLEGIALSCAQIKPILEMAEPILSAEPETSGNKQIITEISGGIELSGVHFRYSENTPYILNGIDLKIRQGEYVAIVGKTGCGKSTLMRLLLGFESPEKGALYYDGIDLSNIDLSSLRRRIGVVTQDGGLFQGDIFSNIVISAPQITLDDAWEAAEIAGIADDIRNMPMGMHTIISEGQGGISGGQKQRLMIARAIAPKPKILMFDEATSALDNKTQKQVSEALDKMGCTRIVIAHRLSTIKNCDRILVLENGVIAEDGTYDALIAKDGLFSDLVKRQKV